MHTSFTTRPHELLACLPAALSANDLPVSMDLVCELLCIRIEVVDLRTRDLTATIQIDAVNDTATVDLDREFNATSAQRRFTLAHAVGHFVQHRHQVRGFTESSDTLNPAATLWQPFDREANRFACQLLMPKSAVLARFTTARLQSPAADFDTLGQGLAAHFDVPAAPMRFWMASMGLLPGSVAVTDEAAHIVPQTPILAALAA